MTDPKKQYEENKNRILNSKLSDLEKRTKLTNNWLDYVQNSIDHETKRENAMQWAKTIANNNVYQ
jgi:hypothetical protein